MRKLSTQELNLLFEFAYQQINSCFWISSTDYRKQIYLSKTFEHIWERSVGLQYEHPEAWREYLVNNVHYEKAVKLLNARRPENEKIPADQVLYQIYTPDQKIKFIRDKSFFILDNADNIIAIAGISESISQAHWENLYYRPSKDDSQCTTNFSNSIKAILAKELKTRTLPTGILEEKQPKLIPIIINDKKVLFTPREIQCLRYIAEGKSAKYIGKILGISYRTVEIFIANIKTKTNIHTKLELTSILSKTMQK